MSWLKSRRKSFDCQRTASSSSEGESFGSLIDFVNVENSGITIPTDFSFNLSCFQAVEIVFDGL